MSKRFLTITATSVLIFLVVVLLSFLLFPPLPDGVANSEGGGPDGMGFEPEIALPTVPELEALGPENDLDTRWLLDDAFFAYVVQPRRFLDSPLGADKEDVLNALLQPMLQLPVDFRTADRILMTMRYGVGIPVQVQDEQGNTYPSIVPVASKSGVVRFVEPVTPERFFSSLMPIRIAPEKLARRKVGAFDCYDLTASGVIPKELENLPTSLLIHFADDHTVVLVEGDQATLDSAFSGKPAAGAVPMRMKRLGLDGFDLAVLLSREGQILPAEEFHAQLTQLSIPPAIVEPLAKTRALTLRFDSCAPDETVVLDAALTMIDAAAAGDLAEQLQAWIVGEQLALDTQTALPGMGDFQAVREIAGKILGSIDVQAEGQLVRLGLKNIAVLRERFEQGVASLREQYWRENLVRRLQHVALGFFQCYRNTGKFPDFPIRSADGTPLLSWRVAILPYIGEEELYKQFQLDKPWDSPANKALLERMPGFYTVMPRPEDAKNADPAVEVPATTKTRMRIFTSPNTPFGTQPFQPESLTSLQTTAMIVVVAPDHAVEWTRPDMLDYESDKLAELFGEYFGMLTFQGELIFERFSAIPREYYDFWITGKAPNASSTEPSQPEPSQPETLIPPPPPVPPIESQPESPQPEPSSPEPPTEDPAAIGAKTTLRHKVLVS